MTDPKPSDQQPRPWYSVLGPGLVTGAADDDPSGIGTYSQVGAQFGYTQPWALLFSLPLMASIQEICARIGPGTGRGIAQNLKEHYPRSLLRGVVLLLLVANVINLGADLGAMGAALALIVPGPALPATIAFGLASILLEVFISYARYAAVLKWATLSLFSYFAVVLLADVDWPAALRGTVVPHFTFDKDHAMALPEPKLPGKRPKPTGKPGSADTILDKLKQFMR